MREKIIEILLKHVRSHYSLQDGGIPDFHFIRSMDISEIADELLAEDKDWKSKPIFPSDAKRVPKQEPDKEETIAMRDGKIKHNK